MTIQNFYIVEPKYCELITRIINQCMSTCFPTYEERQYQLDRIFNNEASLVTVVGGGFLVLSVEDGVMRIDGLQGAANLMNADNYRELCDIALDAGCHGFYCQTESPVMAEFLCRRYKFSILEKVNKTFHLTGGLYNGR